MKQSSKRLISMLCVLVFLVAAFIGFFDFIQPAYTTVGNLRGQEVAQQQLLTTLTATVKQAQQLVASYGSNSAGAAGIALALPAGQDVGGALAQLGGIAAADGLTVTSIAVSTPVIRTQAATTAATTGAATGASSNAQNAKPAGSFSLRVSASGSYENFKTFLADMESNIRIFDVQSVSIQPATGAAAGAGRGRAVSVDYFTYNIVVQTYYQAL